MFLVVPENSFSKNCGCVVEVEIRGDIVRVKMESLDMAVFSCQSGLDKAGAGGF